MIVAYKNISPRLKVPWPACVLALVLGLAILPAAVLAAAKCISSAAVKAAGGCSFDGDDGEDTGPGEGLPDEFKPKKISDDDAKMLDDYSQALCERDEEETQDRLEDCKIKYLKARIFYDANRFQEAAFLFGEVAGSCADDESGRYAVTLYLDSLNVLVKLPGKKKVCMSQIAQATGQYLTGETFKPYVDDKDIGGMLCDVKCAAERHLAQGFHDEGKFLDAAAGYLALYDQLGDKCPGSKMDEILFNLAVELGAAGLNGGAVKAYKILAQDKRYWTTPLAQEALLYLCQVSYGLTQFEEAAGYCEDFVKKFSGRAEAPGALREAVFLRCALGQPDKAAEDAALFQKNYAKKKPDESAMVVFEAGMGYVQAEKWPEAIAYFGKFLKAQGGAGPGAGSTADLRLRANVEIGSAFWKQKKYDKAGKFFEAAILMYEQMSKQPGGEGGGGGAPAAPGDGAVQEAMECAYFHVGEIYYLEFEKTALPKFKPGSPKGKGSKLSDAEVQKQMKKLGIWVEKKLLPAVGGKLDMISRAEAYYQKAFLIRSPKWSIAAVARCALMKIQLYDDIQAVGDEIDKYRFGLLPEWWVHYKDSAGFLLPDLDGEALKGFSMCLDKSLELKVSDEWSGLCQERLGAVDPRQYPLVHEILTAVAPPQQQQGIVWPALAAKKTAGVKVPEKLLEFVQ